MITSGLHKCDSTNLNFAEISVSYQAQQPESLLIHATTVTVHLGLIVPGGLRVATLATLMDHRIFWVCSDVVLLIRCPHCMFIFCFSADNLEFPPHIPLPLFHLKVWCDQTN